MDWYEESSISRVPFPNFLGGLPVPKLGFRWVSTRSYRVDEPDNDRSFDFTEPWLVPVDPLASVRHPFDAPELFKWVDVLNNPQRHRMHRIAANKIQGRSETLPNRILGLANHYGALDPLNGFTLGAKGPGIKPAQTYGECLAAWETHLRELDAYIGLWDVVRTQNIRLATQLVSFLGTNTAIVQWGVTLGRISHIDEDGSSHLRDFIPVGDHDAFDESDVIRPLKVMIARKVASVLRSHVSSSFDEDHFEVVHTPKDLLGALYLHFARELSGRRRLTSICAFDKCGQAFMASRSDQKYCCRSCQNRAHYRRTLVRSDA